MYEDVRIVREVLQETKRRNRWSNTRLAMEIGVPYETLCRIVRGGVNVIHTQTLTRIADGLGKHVDTLTDGDMVKRLDAFEKLSLAVELGREGKHREALDAVRKASETTSDSDRVYENLRGAVRITLTELNRKERGGDAV